MPGAAGRRLQLVAALVAFMCCQVQTDNYEAEIKKALLANYDSRNRPPNDNFAPVNTQITLVMRGFQIDEHQLIASINAWTVMVWHDSRLTWQASDHGNMWVVLMDSSQVWRPDIVLINGVQHVAATYMHAVVPVINTGTVIWATPSTFRVRCLKEMSSWPYDKQNCTAILSSWSLPKDMHEVMPAHPDGLLVTSGDMIKTDSHWQEVSVKGFLRNATYDSFPGSVWHELHVELHVQRVSPLYALAFILPGVAMLIHVLAVFWIPPESSAKIKLATINSVALIFFLFNLFWWMPPVGGKTIPKIMSFVSGSLAMSVLSAVVAVLVMNLVTRSQPPPAALLAVFTGIAVTVLRLGDFNQQLRGTRAPFAEDGAAPVQDKEATGAVRRAEWRLVAAGIDRLVGLLQLAVFVVLALGCLT